MKSKLSHYPYNRPQYEWQKKNIDESFGEYYSKYEAEEVTEDGYYAIREATEEDKNKGYKVAIPNNIYSNMYLYLDNSYIESQTELVKDKYEDYITDPTITELNEEHEYEYSYLSNTLDEIKVEKVYYQEEWYPELKAKMDTIREKNKDYDREYIYDIYSYYEEAGSKYYVLYISYDDADGRHSIANINLNTYPLRQYIPNDYHSNEYHILSPSNYYGFEQDIDYRMLDEYIRPTNPSTGRFGVDDGYILKKSKEISLNDIDISLIPKGITYKTHFDNRRFMLHDITDNIYYIYDDSTNQHISIGNDIYIYDNYHFIIYDGETYYERTLGQTYEENKRPLKNLCIKKATYSLIDQYKAGNYRVNYYPSDWIYKKMYKIPRYNYIYERQLYECSLKNYNGRYSEYQFGEYTILELLDGNIQVVNHFTNEIIDTGINTIICKKNGPYYTSYLENTFINIENNNSSNIFVCDYTYSN